MIFSILAFAAVMAQQPAAPPAEKAVLKAGLGGCSAEFHVTDPEGKPIDQAIVHVKVRYGFMGIRKMDLEVTTNVDGLARVEGLPAKASPLAWDVQKAGRKGSAAQNLAKNCQATFDVAIK